jgi:hypothetical protein
VAVGFDLRTSHLLGRCSTIWATPPAPTTSSYRQFDSMEGKAQISWKFRFLAALE